MTRATAYRIRNLPHRARGWKAELCRAFGLGMVGELSIKVIHADGTEDDYGVVSRRVVTTAGANFVVDAFQNLAELENFNWHASGTNNTAEATSDTALGTEVASRASGTQSEPASNQYRSVGTITYAAGFTIVEHGLFSANAAGTLWDRSVFGGIAVVATDQIQFTYTLTVNAGG